MRVALLAGADAGHVFPIAALARALTDHGHQALVVTAPRWLAALHRDGIDALPLPDLPTIADEPDPVARLHREARRIAPPTADLLAPYAPDLVVADVLAQFGGLVAGLLDIAWVQLIPHQLLDPSPHLPPPGSGLSPATNLRGRLRDRVLYEITRRQWAAGESTVMQNRRALGLDDDARPVARLVAGLPVLQGSRPDWPDDAHQVGPLEWDPSPHDLDPPPGDGPLVFVSASTVDGGATDLLASAIESIAELRQRTGLDLRVACTQFEPAVTALPPWAVAGPGRQATLIEAAAVMVSGAGHGIVSKAVERGVPIVAVPGGGEQGENADRLAAAGLAIIVAPDRVDRGDLTEALLNILTDTTWTTRAAAHRRDTDDRDTADRGAVAVATLESLVSR